VWQGQPVAVVVAESRAEAEDATELVAIEWKPLPAVGDQLQAIAPGAPVIHAELGDNIAFDFSLEKGAPATAFADADIVIEEELRFERQMAMTLESAGSLPISIRPRARSPSFTRTSRRSRCRRCSAAT